MVNTRFLPFCRSGLRSRLLRRVEYNTEIWLIVNFATLNGITQSLSKKDRRVHIKASSRT
jgi:hypothetical protein